MKARRPNRTRVLAGPIILTLAGAIFGMTALSPASAHVSGSPTHLWTKHLAPMAKKLFYTKKQANKRYYTKAQANSRFPTKSRLSANGTINAVTNPVAWTKLKGVPAGLADGADANTNHTGTYLRLNGADTVNGTVTADSFAYRSVHSSVHTVPAHAFRPAMSAMANYTLSDTFIFASAVVPVDLYAPVDLPDGARVTEIEAQVFDNAAGDVTVKLKSYAISAGSSSSLAVAQVQTTGDSVSNRFLTDDANALVDTESQGWFVVANVNGVVASGHKIGKVLIRYEVERPRD